MLLPFSIQPGVLISFLFCYIALAINDLGAIQAVNEMLQTTDMDRRIAKGISVTGLANTASGLLGVIGPVDYTITPGIIAATRCASRFTLVPTALIMLVLAFLPSAIGFIGRRAFRRDRCNSGLCADDPDCSRADGRISETGRFSL
jgi:xanthine/uracil permease